MSASLIWTNQYLKRLLFLIAVNFILILSLNRLKIINKQLTNGKRLIVHYIDVVSLNRLAITPLVGLFKHEPFSTPQGAFSQAAVISAKELSHSTIAITVYWSHAWDGSRTKFCGTR